MILGNVLKQLWYKWRAAVYLAKVEYYGMKRLEFKEKQIEFKKKADEYFGIVRELKKRK